MFVSKELAREYKRQANRIERQSRPSLSATALADLMQRRIKEDMPQFDALVLPERRKHPETLIGALVANKELNILLPVCPPIPKQPTTFKPSVSPEAKAGIRAANLLTGVLSNLLNVDIKALVLLADTESDLEAVVDRAGGVSRYYEICLESLGMVQGELVDSKTDTFSSFFGCEGSVLGYHELQYQAEKTIRQRISDDSSFAHKISAISNGRVDKHELILGRPEQNNELAVRYAAQYTALGDYVRSSEFNAVCNYPTPNNDFYNRLGADIVPLFESRIDRRQP